MGGMRRQNRSCDQCRKAKRACDAPSLQGNGPIAAADGNSQDEECLPCSYCVRTNKRCTLNWARAQRQVAEAALAARPPEDHRPKRLRTASTDVHLNAVRLIVSSAAAPTSDAVDNIAAIPTAGAITSTCPDTRSARIAAPLSAQDPVSLHSPLPATLPLPRPLPSAPLAHVPLPTVPSVPTVPLSSPFHHPALPLSSPVPRPTLPAHPFSFQPHLPSMNFHDTMPYWDSVNPFQTFQDTFAPGYGPNCAPDYAPPFAPPFAHHIAPQIASHTYAQDTTNLATMAFVDAGGATSTPMMSLPAWNMPFANLPLQPHFGPVVPQPMLDDAGMWSMRMMPQTMQTAGRQHSFLDMGAASSQATATSSAAASPQSESDRRRSSSATSVSVATGMYSPSSSLEQLLSTRANGRAISANLLQIYHDVLEHNFSCWITEATCPYKGWGRGDREMNRGMNRGVSRGASWGPDFVADSSSNDNSPQTVMSQDRGRRFWLDRPRPQELGPQWSNRIYLRVKQLDQMAQAAGLINITARQSQDSQRALDLVIMAFATQWAQGSSRQREAYAADFASTTEHGDLAADEFDRRLQRSLWEEARQALQASADVESYRMVCAELIFGFVQRPWSKTDVSAVLGGGGGGDGSGEYSGPAVAASGHAPVSREHILASLEDVLARDGPPIFTERAARKMHSLKYRFDRHEARGLSARVAAEDRATVGLLYWLAVMIDTIQASVHERPVVLADEDSQHDAVANEVDEEDLDDLTFASSQSSESDVADADGIVEAERDGLDAGGEGFIHNDMDGFDAEGQGFVAAVRDGLDAEGEGFVDAGFVNAEREGFAGNDNDADGVVTNDREGFIDAGLVNEESFVSLDVGDTFARSRASNNSRRWRIDLFIQDNPDRQSSSTTRQQRWPCSYDDASLTIARSAPVKVLLYRYVHYLQKLLRARRCNSRVPQVAAAARAAIAVEETVRETLLVYRYWNVTYGAFYHDVVQYYGSVPSRIRGWSVCIAAHWHLAAIMLADVLEELDGCGYGVKTARLVRRMADTVANIRRSSAMQLSDLARMATPVGFAPEFSSGFAPGFPGFAADFSPDFSPSFPPDSSPAPDLHFAVREGTILTEPWSMLLIQAFSRAGILLLREHDELQPRFVHTSQPKQREPSGHWPQQPGQRQRQPPQRQQVGRQKEKQDRQRHGHGPTDRRDGVQRCEDCVRALWLLGKKSDMVRTAATVLSRAMRVDV